MHCVRPLCVNMQNTLHVLEVSTQQAQDLALVMILDRVFAP